MWKHWSLQYIYRGSLEFAFFNQLIRQTIKVQSCWNDLRSSTTKLVETKVENAVNSRNYSIFQIPNSPPYPPISMLNLTGFCCQKSKTLPTTLVLWERGFFTEKQIFYFVSTVLPKILGYWYFLKNPLQIAHWYWAACWCTACFKFNQFKVIKVVCMN